MGSFNTAPKIPNMDSQDDGLELPKGLDTVQLLQHVKQLHGKYQPPLLERRFVKPSQPLDLSYDLTDGMRFLELNKVSRVCSAPDVNEKFQGADISDTDILPVAGNQLRILQWNVLAQTLSQHNDGFVRCPQEALTWEHRKFLIVQEILQNKPDVICLQEVDHFKFLKNVLGSQNYDGIFFPKPDSPCLYIEENNGPDGCAIFYKSDKLSLKAFETRVLEVWRVQSNQVAIAMKLQINETGREFCVFTTHLKARTGSLLAKLRNEQGRDLVSFVKNFAGELPAILCGDFNAEPVEPVYSTILNCDALKLRSAYADIQKTEDTNGNNKNENVVIDDGNGGINAYVMDSINREPPYTTWKIREEGEQCHTIDYIFYTKNNLKVINCLDFPLGDEIGIDRTPSLQYPSDHFSLVCDFELLDVPPSDAPKKTIDQNDFTTDE